jgi:putative NADH-flavin reductase
MPTPKILVLGATGPAGICLLRELLHRQHAVVAYARNVSKIPSSLTSHPLLSIIQGEMSDRQRFSTAIQGCTAVISHLGAQITDRGIPHRLYADMYSGTVIPGMRSAGVKKILLMGTMAITRPEDSFTISTPLILAYMNLFARAVYRNILNVAEVFEMEGRHLDWTIFRIAAIPGEADEEGWRKGREEGRLYVGPVGGKGWTMNTNRSLLARWLVDCVEGGGEEWVRGMPAVTRLAGS